VLLVHKELRDRKVLLVLRELPVHRERLVLKVRRELALKVQPEVRERLAQERKAQPAHRVQQVLRVLPVRVLPQARTHRFNSTTTVHLRVMLTSLLTKLPTWSMLLH
jgi:hypothetical protein